MNDSEKIILERIKNLRNQKGISQTKLAEAIGISQTGYAKIERGDTENIPLSVAVGIAKALNVGFNELFDIDGDSRKIDGLINEIELLKNRISEKSLLIEALMNEKLHSKERFVMQLVDDYSFDMDFVDEYILKAENEEEKDKLIDLRQDIVAKFTGDKDHYLKIGFLSQSDFDDHYKFMASKRRYYL